jgi:hypothetical protein
LTLDHDVTLLTLLTTGVGFVMVRMGLGSKLLNWSQPDHCPACGRFLDAGHCPVCEA